MPLGWDQGCFDTHLPSNMSEDPINKLFNLNIDAELDPNFDLDSKAQEYSTMLPWPSPNTPSSSVTCTTSPASSFILSPASNNNLSPTPSYSLSPSPGNITSPVARQSLSPVPNTSYSLNTNRLSPAPRNILTPSETQQEPSPSCSSTVLPASGDMTTPMPSQGTPSGPSRSPSPSPSSTSSANAPLLPPCRVCGEKASGFHYGANTCEACKVSELRKKIILPLTKYLRSMVIFWL